MSIFKSQSRAEDPNVSMRLIEKIKHKCQDYFREPSTPSDTYISDLQSDIMQFKKDCLVAVELAYQYIIKSVELSPAPISRSDQLKLEYEIDKLTDENNLLKQEIESLKNSKHTNENVVNLDNLIATSGDDDEKEKMISELQGQLVVQEMRFENALADLEAENRELKEEKEKVDKEIKECLRKNEILEKKVKESFSGFGKLMSRKSTANKEVQSKKAECCIEAGSSIEIQRSTDLMSQISKLSITESEIFDMTSMQVCDIHHQADTSITKTCPVLSLELYPSTLPQPLPKLIQLETLQTSSIHIHPSRHHQSPPAPVLSTTKFDLKIFPQAQSLLNLSTFQIFTHKNSLQISTGRPMTLTHPKQVYSSMNFKCFSSVKILGIHTEKTVGCEKTPAEESKSRINRRKSTLNSASDRKPAIEEYFSLTFQAAKMKVGNLEKNLNADELYQRAVSLNVPFFEWNDWVISQMKA